MFYLKYRPQTIAQLDSPAIRERLTSILTSEKLPHAFLFAGPKGIGKTSTARILAKAINCEQNFCATGKGTAEPCNQCTSCKAIDGGNTVDIIEMDGASHRRIDDIRDLNASVSLAPVYSRYKVYIIDEVHMLTQEAFNALLKTLEEPPSRVIFILATTEMEKLPTTIVSRCIVLQFTKAKPEDVMGMLKRVAQKEKLTIKDDVLQKITDFSDGAFRDAVKILEEASLRQTEITIELISELVGVDSAAETLLSLIEKKDIKQIFSFLHDFDTTGKSCKVLTASFLDMIHQLLLAKQGIAEQKKETTLTSRQLMQLLKGFQTAFVDLKNTPIQTLPIEIAVVEYFGKNK